MLIVSDTTPLSELAKVGYLHILQDIYGVIIIPRQVYNELIASNIEVVASAAHANFVEVRDVSNFDQLVALQTVTKLGAGESAAFVLAQELTADRVLVDDLVARRNAEALGLSIIGTVGTLLIAKQLGLLPSIKNVLDSLIANGMRISPRLYQETLAQAGE